MSKKKRQLRELSVARDRSEPSETTETYQATELIDGFSQANDQAGGLGMWQRLKANWLLVGIAAFFALGALGSGLKYLEEDARKQMLNGNLKAAGEQNQGLLNRINPFLPAAVPNPTPQLSKEYVYAGDRLLAVEDANASAVPPSDLAVWRPSTGYWYVMGPGGSIQASQQWGTSGDKPEPGDYDGDGKTDFCVFRPSDNTWYILNSSTVTLSSVTYGTTGDERAQADYDGDGKTDIAVFRPSNTTWYVRKSSDGTTVYLQFGSSGDLPASADYDGDGRADYAVWRPSDQKFYSLRSSNGVLDTISFGQTAAELISADYDGDGKADYAIRNGANWVIRYSSTGVIQSPIAWQQLSDKAVHNDYDGDGKVDIAVWRDSNGNWYIRNSSTGNLRQESWGTTGDEPVPVFYRR